MADELTLLVGDRPWSVWTSIRVIRGIERFPSYFEVEMTERYPSESKQFVVVPGDECKVLLGEDLVLTGFVDGYSTRLSIGQHSSRIYGRSKCADLVDASAEWPGGQINMSSALEIAKKLAFNFSIDVEGGPEGLVAQLIPSISLMYGESSYSIIERVCRYSALLAYDTPEGKLRLSRAGFLRGASSLVEGKNVQDASIDYRIDERFSEYHVVTTSYDAFSDFGAYDIQVAIAKDPGVKRYRRKYIVSEAGDTNYSQAELRAHWEYRRRAGRSAQLRVTTDSWRDVAGNLWEPNTLCHLDLPSMKLVNKWWLIAEVSYKQDGYGGTTCDLVLMPAEAFDIPPPEVQQFGDIRRALAGTPLEEGSK